MHKKAALKWLSPDIVYRKKKGFANPVDQWLRGRMRDFVNSCVLSEQSAVNKCFNKEFIEEMVLKHESKEQNYLRHINLLISFELWHQKFIPA